MKYNFTNVLKKTALLLLLFRCKNESNLVPVPNRSPRTPVVIDGTENKRNLNNEGSIKSKKEGENLNNYKNTNASAKREVLNNSKPNTKKEFEISGSIELQHKYELQNGYLILTEKVVENSCINPKLVWKGKYEKKSGGTDMDVFVKMASMEEIENHKEINANFPGNTPGIYDYCPVKDRSNGDRLLVMEDVSKHEKNIKKDGSELVKIFLEIIDWCFYNSCPLKDISSQNIVQDCLIDFDPKAGFGTPFFSDNEVDNRGSIKGNRVALGRSLFFLLHEDWISKRANILIEELKKDNFIPIVMEMQSLYCEKIPWGSALSQALKDNFKTGSKYWRGYLKSLKGLLGMLYVKNFLDKINNKKREEVLLYLKNRDWLDKDRFPSLEFDKWDAYESYCKEIFQEILSDLPQGKVFPWEDLIPLLKSDGEYTSVDDTLVKLAKSGSLP